MIARLRDALGSALIAALLIIPFAGVRLTDGLHGNNIAWHESTVLAAAALVFFLRLLMGSSFSKKLSRFFSQGSTSNLRRLPKLDRCLPFLAPLLVIGCVLFPLTPWAGRYALDIAIMVLTYVMLAWGLSVTVGLAGLLDLGYVAFYAIGAYCYGLLATHFSWDFWLCLPLAGAIAAAAGLLMGLPVLRLRGDYFAIVTLGFGEIMRLLLINWSNLTGGPNGLSNIPRPSFFGLEFTRSPNDGQQSFNEFFNLAFDPLQRVIFLYYIILALVLLVGWFVTRLRLSPLGRALEAFREDEIACAALGINRWRIKLAAYAISATIAGVAGAFFAARQGFISPESFTFLESATILAIIILGGMGRLSGMVLAAIFIIALPELFREFEQYRMLAFGLGMVLIMVWRPGGMAAKRVPMTLLKIKDTKTLA